LWTRRFEWPSSLLHCRHQAAVDDINIIKPERVEKEAVWQMVKSKVMTEEAQIIFVS
jgi:hypothetical protein